MLNGYIDMLAAVEKLSFRRGQEDDVSLFAIEDVPSFNCFAIFRFPSIALPLLLQGCRQATCPKRFSKLVKLRSSLSNPIL